MSRDNQWGSKGSGNAVYGLGLIGAAVYYIPKAHTFWHFIVAIGKSIVWPAILIYSLLRYLHA